MGFYMRIIKLADLEAKVLDKNERNFVEGVIRSEAKKREVMMRLAKLNTPKGYTDGQSAFVMANAFEDIIINKSLDFNLRNTHIYVSFMDTLSKEDPQYWEFPFINGKNLLSALEKREGYIIETAGGLGTVKDIRSLKEEVIKDYHRVDNYIKRALELFNHFKKDDKLLDTYYFMIKDYSAKLKRREIFFKIRSEPNLSKILQTSVLSEILKIGKELDDFYIERFSNTKFLDKKNAAIALANYANAIKLQLSRKSIDRGLAYYESAREILGDLPRILEGISYYEEAKLYQGVNQFVSLVRIKREQMN